MSSLLRIIDLGNLGMKDGAGVGWGGGANDTPYCLEEPSPGRQANSTQAQLPPWESSQEPAAAEKELSRWLERGALASAAKLQIPRDVVHLARNIRWPVITGSASSCENLAWVHSHGAIRVRACCRYGTAVPPPTRGCKQPFSSAGHRNPSAMDK